MFNVQKLHQEITIPTNCKILVIHKNWVKSNDLTVQSNLYMTVTCGNQRGDRLIEVHFFQRTIFKFLVVLGFFILYMHNHRMLYVHPMNMDEIRIFNISIYLEEDKITTVF